MNTEQCIKNAIEADASGNTGEAMQWLKQAGEFGDANAALDYAYFKSAENPRKSVAFLEGGGESVQITPSFSFINYKLAIMVT